MHWRTNETGRCKVDEESAECSAGVGEDLLGGGVELRWDGSGSSGDVYRAKCLCGVVVLG